MAGVTAEMRIAWLQAMANAWKGRLSLRGSLTAGIWRCFFFDFPVEPPEILHHFFFILLERDVYSVFIVAFYSMSIF